MLLPLWRTSETYMALRLAHMDYERAHQLARVRNNDGGDHNIIRPRKIGLAWQQLRGSASILIGAEVGGSATNRAHSDKGPQMGACSRSPAR
jgi:hypothetical protein